MKVKVHYSPEAQKDLISVWKGVYAASKSFDIADQYADDLMDTIDQKSIFPFSGIPLCYKGLFTGIYSVNFKAYKAFYRIRENYLEVIRVIPVKMDYLKKLFPEE